MIIGRIHQTIATLYVQLNKHKPQDTRKTPHTAPCAGLPSYIEIATQPEFRAWVNPGVT